MGFFAETIRVYARRADSKSTLHSLHCGICAESPEMRDEWGCNPGATSSTPFIVNTTAGWVEFDRCPLAVLRDRGPSIEWAQFAARYYDMKHTGNLACFLNGTYDDLTNNAIDAISIYDNEIVEIELESIKQGKQ